MSPAMIKYARKELAHTTHLREPRRELIDALYNRGKLQLSYDAGATRSAAEAFDERAGNCLSLVIMTAAFARHMGLPVTFQSVLSDDSYSRIGDLHLVSGQIARPGAGPFSLTGQPNAMGGREAGGLAQLLPGYRAIANPADRAVVERHWGLAPGAIAAEPGLAVWQQVEAMERGAIGLWWVAATNPLVSLPWLDRVRAAAQNCPLVVLSEAYAGTETAAVAHLLLPAAQWSEKAGVMTNSERRVSRS
jgi:anaerobic selenocysteine-containing dehydrogenase